ASRQSTLSCSPSACGWVACLSRSSSRYLQTLKVGCKAPGQSVETMTPQCAGFSIRFAHNRARYIGRRGLQPLCCPFLGDWLAAELGLHRRLVESPEKRGLGTLMA